MATIGARLKSDGTLQTVGSFDEYGDGETQTAHKITTTNIFADELDEITLPSKSPSGGSVSLNGTSQYLSVSGSGDLQFGTDNFTIEGWFYSTSTQYQRLWCFPDGDNVELMNGQIYYWKGSGAPIGAGSYTFNMNTWNHIALVKKTTVGVNDGEPVVNVYINGRSKIVDNSPYNSTSSRSLAIGGEIDLSVTGQNPVSETKDGYFAGYITQFRIVKGVAVYTGAFSTPRNPLTKTQDVGVNISAISGSSTKLLLTFADSNSLLTDSSDSAQSVTNVGTATWQTQTPSATTYNGAMKQFKTGELMVENEFDEVLDTEPNPGTLV
jgi:hypothetical protein